MERGVHSVCFRGDFAIKHTSWIPTLKLVWKCVTRWSILFMCNTFSCWLVLLSFLYIVLALVCCANSDNIHLFPVPMQSDQYRSCSTAKRRDGCRLVHPDLEQPKHRCGSVTHLFVRFVNESTLAIWFWRIIVKRPRILSAQFVVLYKPCKPKPKPSRNDMISTHQRSARTNDGKTTLI